ncbi:redoxin domain-containing protein, partial [Prosthecobacter sp.]|uniref:redoxin domain-containing protein n=1 Tax=Prosthecobacter sp. TaxID=1965333 RepID=UPI002487CDDB
MKKVLLILLASTALAASVAGLRAQAQLTDFDEKFKAFDQNSDGIISGDEMKGASYLPRLDLNKDGKLTREEALEAVQKMRKLTGNQTAGIGNEPTAALFKRLDKNSDGKLTADELPNPKWFNNLDTDKDGAVTLSEAETVMASLRKRGSTGSSTAGTPVKPAAEDPSFKEAPQWLKGSEHGVGRMVADTALKTLKGDEIKLSNAAGKNGLVVALFSTSCPISGRLAPEMARLEKDMKEQGVGVLLVNAPPGQKAEDVAKF